MGGRVDLTSWNVLYYSLSLFLSIYLSSLCLIWCLSLPGSPSNPTAVPPPFCFLLSTVSFSTFAFHSLPLPLMCFFFSLLCVCSFFSLILGWNLRWDQHSRSPLLLWLWAHSRVEMTPELRGSDLFSFSLLSAPALSLHTALLLFISEHQFQQGSSTGRTWKGWSELGTKS